MARKCAIASCDNLLAEHAHPDTLYCAACRQMFGYWYKKSPADVLERQHRLDKWRERMEELSTQPRGKKHARVVTNYQRALRREFRAGAGR